jgi:hypothetical protein
LIDINSIQYFLNKKVGVVKAYINQKYINKNDRYKFIDRYVRGMVGFVTINGYNTTEIT